jgi:archaellum component FlaC
MHLLSGEPEIETQINEIKDTPSNDDDRITKLETELELLKNEVNEIKTKFEKFKQQFE